MVILTTHSGHTGHTAHSGHTAHGVAHSYGGRSEIHTAHVTTETYTETTVGKLK
jgi:hypothetical protein